MGDRDDAARDGVVVTTAAGPAEADAALDLAERVWGVRPLVPAVLRALELAGGYVSVARAVAPDSDTDPGTGPEAGPTPTAPPIGMCAGFVGVHDAADSSPGHGHHLHLHSHLAAVDPAWRGRGVGRALKRHQRTWCLERGITTVSWTFDPLLVANARFNLHHLGAAGDRYLVDLYGPMDDDINRGDPSDRLLVRWDLDGPTVRAALGSPLPAPSAARLRAEGAVDAVVGEAGTPVHHPVDPASHVRLVATPPDAVAMRRADPDRARAWRLAVRAAMLDAAAVGLVPTAVTDDDRYVLSSPVDPPEPR